MLHHLGIRNATSQSTVSSLHIESTIVDLAVSNVPSRAMNRSFRKFLRPISKLALSFVSFLFVLWLHSDDELIVGKIALFTCRYVVLSAKLPILSRLYSNRSSIQFLSGLRCRLNRVRLSIVGFSVSGLQSYIIVVSSPICVVGRLVSGSVLSVAGR